jgi:hypothetical protein
MTTTTALKKEQWKPYFDQVSRGMNGKNVEIEVAALDVGIQFAAKWLPLFGVSYDDADDIIAVMAEGLNHLIRKPSTVYIESDGVDVLSMEVIDANGAAQIMRFREPLLLPAS